MTARVKQIIKTLLRFPMDLFAQVLVKSSTKLSILLSQPLLENPMLSAKFFPHEDARFLSDKETFDVR